MSDPWSPNRLLNVLFDTHSHTQRMSSSFLEKSCFMLIVVDVCNEFGVVSVAVYNGERVGYALFRSASAFLETQLPG